MMTMYTQTLAIVRLQCSDGIEGIGEATCIGGLAYGEQSPEGIKLAIDTYMAPLLAEVDATNVNAAMARVGKHVQGNSFAKSAIETALLDAQGKRLGLPVHALLGGACRKSLPVLWTLASGDSGRDIEEARAMIDAKRHCVFKLKIGRREPMQDVAHVARIKQALGAETLITVDVNQAWSEMQAERAIAALQADGVDLIEQPVARERRDAMARLARRFTVPIMADEAVHDAVDAYDYAHHAAADVYALKISKAGGLLPTLRAAAVADASGIGLYGGTMLEGSIGSIASAHAFAALPQLEWGTELFGPLLLKDDIVVHGPTYRDCALWLDDAPGLGVSLDEDKLAFYRRDRRSTAVAAATRGPGEEARPASV